MAAHGDDMESCMEAVAYFLLDNQYINSEFVPGRFWKATRGTGIGLLMSGDRLVLLVVTGQAVPKIGVSRADWYHEMVAIPRRCLDHVGGGY